MKHPESAQTIEVSPTQVALYESQGWEKYTPKNSTTRKSATAATKKES